MKAVFQGRRYFVVQRLEDNVWIERVASAGERRLVSVHDRDLILDPSDEDLDLAEAFERGEIGAFEYLDGHTYPEAKRSGAGRTALLLAAPLGIDSRRVTASMPIDDRPP